MNNMDIYGKFKGVPEEAKKKITGGRLSGFTDINPMWRIKMLTEQFGICGFGWRYEIVSQELKEGAKGEIAAFVTINLYVKVGENWSEAIPGIGGSSFVANEKNGLYTSDECFKMAFTDSLSIACKSLGMGADVYFEKDRSKYDQKEQKEEKIEFNKEEEEKKIESMKTAKEVSDYWVEKKAWQGIPDFVSLIANKGKKLKDAEKK